MNSAVQRFCEDDVGTPDEAAHRWDRMLRNCTAVRAAAQPSPTPSQSHSQRFRFNHPRRMPGACKRRLFALTEKSLRGGRDAAVSAVDVVQRHRQRKLDEL